MKKYLLTIILALCVCSLPLMGGRLRVGDWIECEGIRGKVTAINYQCVLRLSKGRN